MSTYTAVYRRDAAGWWYVSVPELPACQTQGRTVDQARERIREAAALWLDLPESSLTIQDDVLSSEAS